MKITTTTSTIAAALCLSSSSISAFQQHHGRSTFQYNRRTLVSPSSVVREMKTSNSIIESNSDERPRTSSSTTRRTGRSSSMQKLPITSLSVATLGNTETQEQEASLLSNLRLPSNIDAITKVLSASLLVTGNTVGPSMFVLPEAVGGIGMVEGSAIFVAMYIYNLISGLLLADVAINLHESSDCEVPSSFKDFVDEALKSETAGNTMAIASLISNSCFLAFGVVHAGSLLVNTFPSLGLDPTLGAGAFAAMIALFSVTQTNSGLEKIANSAVIVLFSSFATLLLPSMANVNDPIGTLVAPGTNPDGFDALAAAVPLILSSLVYQNIVPSITKLLDFDRTKSTIAIALGSFLPMAMYISWCFASLGGGLDSSTANDAGAAAFTAFSAAALVGSCIPAVMSIAEEYESIFAKAEDDGSCPIKNKFSATTVAASMLPPVAVALAFSKGGDLTGALHFNGVLITPFLYGLLPIILYQSVQKNEADEGSNSLFSISNLPQVLLGVGTLATLIQEASQDLPNLLPTLAA